MKYLNPKTLLTTLPFFISLIYFYAEFIVVLFSVLGGIYIYINKKNAKDIFSLRISNITVLKIAICFSAIFFIKLLSTIWSINPIHSIGNSFNHLQFLFWPFIFVFIYKLNINIIKTEPFLIGSLIAMFLWLTFLKYFYADSEQAMCFAAGAHNCGLLELTLAFILSWVTLIITRIDTKVYYQIFYGMCYIAGFIVLLATERRTSLLGLLIVTFLILSVRLYNNFNYKRFFLYSTLLILVCSSVALFSNRYKLIVNEVSAYSQGGDQRKANVVTSVGARLEMYRMAIAAISEKPLLGWGAGTKPSYVSQFATDPKNPPPYSVFHNQYLQILVEVGVIGFVFILILTIYILRKTSAQLFNSVPQEHVYILATLYFLYIFKSFLGSTFGYSHTNSVFVLFSAWLIANITQPNQNQ